MFLFQFWEDFGWVSTILVALVLFLYLRKDMPPMLALLLVVVITFVLLVPYDWFKYLLFIVIFMWGFWSKMGDALS
ncbi:hypothetical protein HY991_03710 [Candidatus Micrarchaeota archaeon]|nr:hypothetical protein [Candidatus Micrarchaeota archaeon]